MISSFTTDKEYQHSFEKFESENIILKHTNRTKYPLQSQHTVKGKQLVSYMLDKSKNKLKLDLELLPNEPNVKMYHFKPVEGYGTAIVKTFSESLSSLSSDRKIETIKNIKYYNRLSRIGTSMKIPSKPETGLTKKISPENLLSYKKQLNFEENRLTTSSSLFNENLVLRDNFAIDFKMIMFKKKNNTKLFAKTNGTFFLAQKSGSRKIQKFILN
jgi:hypothetical protein